MEKEIMTPENARWRKFTHLLADKLKTNGCTNDVELAPKILEEMGDIDIEKTLEYFQNEGGWCDCEILMNVDR